jgi:DNA mismatch repair protein MutH
LPKNINEMIVARILDLRGRVSRTAEFLKAGIVPKTIQLEPDGRHVRESMSFPVFHFAELVEEDWESSGLKEMFDTTRFFFIVFRKRDVGTPTLEGAFFWNMPSSDLDQVREVWTNTQNIAIRGVEFSKAAGRRGNNLPKASDNRVCHVRPHGRDGNDTDTLPDGSMITKQCFWLNNTYIAALVADWKGQSR